MPRRAKAETRYRHLSVFPGVTQTTVTLRAEWTERGASRWWHVEVPLEDVDDGLLDMLEGIAAARDTSPPELRLVR